MKINKFIKVLAFVDFMVILVCFFKGTSITVINTQIAFFTSMIVFYATFISYKRNVQKAVDVQMQDGEYLNSDDPDMLDEIEDPYDLYSEDEIGKSKELNASEIKAVIDEEKTKIRKNSFKNLYKTGGSFVSFFRIFGYASLVFGFFYLTNNSMFEPISYLIGVSVVPFSIICYKIIPFKQKP